MVSSRGVTVILPDVAREQIDRGLANRRKNIRTTRKAPLDERGKSETGSCRGICELHRAHGVAGCTIRMSDF